jgi:hypothetical protein
LTITAKVIADSIGDDAPRITTIQLRYPRFIHAELLTHRVFSRNSSSSRAIPVERLIQDVIDDTAMPIHWGKNMAGMQAKEECNEMIPLLGPSISIGSGKHMPCTREEAWLEARDRAIEVARAFAAAGYHKQIVNRLLEPFAHINVIVTATQWSNFLALRDHEDAQPEIHELARCINKELSENTPTKLNPGEWHLPYVDRRDAQFVELYQDLQAMRNHGGQDEEFYKTFDPDKQFRDALIKCSVARCARVSYLTHDKKVPKVQDDLKLYDRLLAAVPLHASPAEHQASPDKRHNGEYDWNNKHLHGNLSGWIQYRKTLPNECQ